MDNNYVIMIDFDQCFMRNHWYHIFITDLDTHLNSQSITLSDLRRDQSFDFDKYIYEDHKNKLKLKSNIVSWLKSNKSKIDDDIGVGTDIDLSLFFSSLKKIYPNLKIVIGSFGIKSIIKIILEELKLTEEIDFILTPRDIKKPYVEGTETLGNKNEYFDKIRKQFGIELPNENFIFFDDSINNILAATAIGIDAYHCKPFNKNCLDFIEFKLAKISGTKIHYKLSDAIFAKPVSIDIDKPAKPVSIYLINRNQNIQDIIQDIIMNIDKKFHSNKITKKTFYLLEENKSFNLESIVENPINILDSLRNAVTEQKKDISFEKVDDPANKYKVELNTNTYIIEFHTSVGRPDRFISKFYIKKKAEHYLKEK